MSNHTTIFKGQTVDKELASWMFISNVNSDGKCYITYEITDKTNDFKYYGKTTIRNPGKLIKYTGSGSILKYFQKKNGIHNFVVEIKNFWETDTEARLEEARVVNYDYIHRFDTYNTTLGGTKLPVIDTNNYYFCPYTNTQFSGYKTQKSKFQNFGMVEGLSPEHKARTGFGSKEGRKRLSKMHSNVTLITPNGEEICVPTTSVKNYIKQTGFLFKSTRVWMHKPGETNYVRGENWTQPLTNNVGRIRDMIDQGWDFGIPSNHR